MKKKVLIIKLGAIGDVIHTTSIATAIKETHPDWEVHHLTSGQITPIVEVHPHIDKVYEWDIKKRKSYKYLWEIASQLRKEHYDIIFNMSRTLRNTLISILSFPKKIIEKQDFNKPWVEEYFLSAQKYVTDISLPKRLYCGTNKESDKTIEENLKNYPRPYIIISPAGEAHGNRPGRTWSLTKWDELTKELKNFGGTIFTIGSEKEAEAHSILSNTIIFSGKFTLQETASFIAQADLFIAGDTGPSHLAAAYEIPTITLFGSTSPDKIRPHGENNYIVESPHECRYCWKKKKCPIAQDAITTPCMEAISPETIIKIIKENHLL